MKKLLILTLLGVLFVPMNGSAKADEVLYSVSEVATGINRSDGFWKEAKFERKRFTVKVTGDFEKVVGIWDKVVFECKYPYSITDGVSCQAAVGESFVYSKSIKRFVYSKVNTASYVLNYTPPVLYAGTCEKF